MTDGFGRRLQRLETLWPRQRPVVMGILNCTPDSFSDGGRYFDVESAIRHGERLLDDGAAIVDIGGESTRPGADAVPAAEESRRVLPVLGELRARRPEAVLSIDTSKPEVAAAALEAGADVVNDVTAGSEPEIFELAADHGAALVLMHMRGTPRTMQQDVTYLDVVAEVHGYLLERARTATASGVAADRIWLDPGIGFGKDAAGNLALIAALPDLAVHSHPVVLGPSNKAFIGRLTGAELGDRLPGTLGALIPVLSLERAVVRVHDAAAVTQFLEIAARVIEASA